MSKIFKPAYSESYFYILIVGKPVVYGALWDDNNLDLARLKTGNCFATKTEAEAKLKLIKKLLKGAL